MNRAASPHAAVWAASAAMLGALIVTPALGLAAPAHAATPTAAGPVAPLVFRVPLPLDPPGDPTPPPNAPVPTPDEVAGLLNQLTDPGIPDPAKASLVEGGLSPDELSEIDDHDNQFNGLGYLPINFVVTDIQPAPNNYAGATVTVPNGPYTPPSPVVLVKQGGRWLITHDTLMPFLDALWRPKLHRSPHWHPVP